MPSSSPWAARTGPSPPRTRRDPVPAVTASRSPGDGGGRFGPDGRWYDCAVPADRTGEVLDRLREHGGRITGARRATVAVLLGADGAHLSAERIAELVQAELPDVAESTIYRTLTALEVNGIVEHVHLGHGPSTYHLTSEPHQHLVCEACGCVIEVPDETFAGLASTLDREYGFEVSFRHFAILGRCRACRTAAGPTGPDQAVPSAPTA